MLTFITEIPTRFVSLSLFSIVVLFWCWLLCHQLHTPLTGILGASYLMATTSLTSEQEEYLAYIVSSAEQLKHVISDILDFKQLGTELTIEKQPVSIRDCLNEALHQSGILTLSSTGNPGVTCHIANDVPDYVLSDRGRILQIFVNLIHNSMRFSTRDSWGLDVSITNLGFLPPSPPSTPPSSLSPSSSPLSSITPSSSSSTTPFPSSSSITPSSSSTLTLPSFSTPTLSTQPLVHIPSLSTSTTTTTTIEPTPISPLSPPEPSISSSSFETNLPKIQSSSLTAPIPPVFPFISPSITASPSTPKLRFIPPRIIPPPYPYSLPSPNLSPLSVFGQRTNGLRCLLRITVRDNGKGMEPGALLDVFHPDNSLSRIKHILELLNGDISIESAGTGQGTTATITLKAEIWSPPSSPTPPSPSVLSSLASLSPSSLLLSRHAPPRVRSLPLHSSLSSPSLSNSATLPSSSSSSLSPRNKMIPGIFKDLSVLLVEDNLMNQKVLRRLFGKLGIQPDVASHGAQAVEYVRNKKYHIVFMDLHMPVCDGFEATKQIQQLPPPIYKPRIYALTASVSSQDKDKCLSVGMQGHLPKPVSVQALVDALSSVNIS